MQIPSLIFQAKIIFGICLLGFNCPVNAAEPIEKSAPLSSTTGLTSGEKKINDKTQNPRTNPVGQTEGPRKIDDKTASSTTNPVGQTEGEKKVDDKSAAPVTNPVGQTQGEKREDDKSATPSNPTGQTSGERKLDDKTAQPLLHPIGQTSGQRKVDTKTSQPTENMNEQIYTAQPVYKSPNQKRDRESIAQPSEPQFDSMKAIQSDPNFGSGSEGDAVLR